MVQCDADGITVRLPPAGRVPAARRPCCANAVSQLQPRSESPGKEITTDRANASSAAVLPLAVCRSQAASPSFAFDALSKAKLAMETLEPTSVGERMPVTTGRFATSTEGFWSSPKAW